jgi:hypothetical protein
MHPQTKLLIRQRAEKIGRVATYILNHFDGDEEVATALKFSWLFLRGPRSLRQHWGDDDLEIDATKVENFLWKYQERLFPGRFHLFSEERDLLSLHNDESIGLARARFNRQLGARIALPLSTPEGGGDGAP